MNDQLTIKYPALLAEFSNTIWACEPNWLNTAKGVLLGVQDENFVKREDSPTFEAIARIGERLDGTNHTRIIENVAIINVIGGIVPRASYFTEVSGLTSIQSLTNDLLVVLDNPKIDSILLVVDSPGGSVNGVAEFADLIYQANTQKKIKITGWTQYLAASAGYWIISACGDVVASETAQLGSIGVQASLTDYTEYYKQKGIREVSFKSKFAGNKNLDPLTPEGKKAIEDSLTETEKIFHAKVARNRQITVEDVQTKFGQGAMFSASQAVEIGMADRLGSFFETLALLLNSNETKQQVWAVQSAQLEANQSLLEIKTQEKDEIKMAEPTFTEDDFKAMQKEVADAKAKADLLQTENASFASRIETLQGEMQTAELTARNLRLSEIAKTFAGDLTENTKLLTEVAEKFGEDSQFFKSYVAKETANAKALETAGLFTTHGKNPQDNGAKVNLAELSQEEILKMSDEDLAKAEVV